MNARQRLHDLMCVLSDRYWCAGWVAGLEFTLWSVVTGGDCHGTFTLPEDFARDLRALSREAGGWPAWDGGGRGSEEFDGDPIMFLPLPDWEDHYKSYQLCTALKRKGLAAVMPRPPARATKEPS